jgi:hypothetical protein
MPKNSKKIFINFWQNRQKIDISKNGGKAEK